MNEKNFNIALIFTVLQQALLATSTYFIAMAGATLPGGNFELVVQHISLFFTFALSAYIASSISSIFTTKASNITWLRYTESALSEACSDMRLSSEKNKKSLVQWISGEASSTISHACAFYLGITSACLNIVLTLAVFFLAVGVEITATISASLLISLSLVMALKKKINYLASDMQKKRLDALLSIESTWDSAAFGSQKMRRQGFDELGKNANSYFSQLDKYVLMEQVVACLPIVLATIIVTVSIQMSGFLTAATAGALVAMLPRSLQVFGSIHSLSIYFSQLFLVRSKMKNLRSFVSGLDKHEGLLSMDLNGIKIQEQRSSETLAPSMLLENLKNCSLTNGRYLVTGNNGAGKSSYLKIIKSVVDDSLLMMPETNFIKLKSGQSTGEARLSQIKEILVSAPLIVMLDEWDANLDLENFKRINTALDLASETKIVIESRHRRDTAGTMHGEAAISFI